MWLKMLYVICVTHIVAKAQWLARNARYLIHAASVSASTVSLEQHQKSEDLDVF